MFDSRRKPNGCGSGATLVAYLYGELGEDERDGFETHLEECDGCADELASFAELRISIADAKAAAPLDVSGVTGEPVTKGSWIDAIRELLVSSMGVRAFAGVAAAVLLIVAGFYVAGVFSGEQASPDVAADPTPDAVTPSPAALAEAPELASQTAEDPEPLVNEPDIDAAEAPVRAAATRREKPSTRRSRPARPSVQVAEVSEPPRLSEAAAEDVDDDSLRLTDLFSDVSED